MTTEPDTERIRAEPNGVLPSWLLGPILLTCIWTAAAPFAFADVSTSARLGMGTIPAGVAFAVALGSWRLWLSHGKPWHDWSVIVTLLPAIGAAVWITVGALILELDLARAELLGLSVGPGVALIGLLTTTTGFYGRHHPDPARDGYRRSQPD